MDAGIHEREQPVDHLDPRRRVVAGERVRAQQHRRAADFFGKRFTHAGRVGLDQLGLEQHDVLHLDAGVFQHADAGVEAVHHRRFIVHPGRFDIVAALFQRGARGGGQRHLHAGVARHRNHLRRAQREAVDGDGCHGVLPSVYQFDHKFDVSIASPFPASAMLSHSKTRVLPAKVLDEIAEYLCR